jgi:hypothetical protein
VAPPSLTHFVNGMNAMAAIVACLYFVRFWRQTADRFFACMAVAFALLALNWIVLAVFDPSSEFRPLVYALRLIAFLVIIAAIVDKNLGNHRSR